MDSHGFVICAYKDSPYLCELIESLLAQTARSRILMATSTPTDTMRGIAAEYGVPLLINEISAGIASDWNFAYAQAETDFVTLAHQDDIYEPAFTECAMDAFSREKNPILTYANYFEIRPQGRVYDNRLLHIKRLMNAPIVWFPRSRFVRNRVFSMGCPVSCPSVTFNRKRFPDFRFTDTYRNDMDWEAWYRLAKEPGAFLHMKEPLVGHRIHEGSETTNSIGSGVRSAEDFDMYRKFWPAPIARFLLHFYERGLESNDLNDLIK
ncbi:MAG: glycosyltransferase [Clostridiales bacterium]|nr:glycosyltransferase [Clostridiales bacterium]